MRFSVGTYGRRLETRKLDYMVFKSHLLSYMKNGGCAGVLKGGARAQLCLSCLPYLTYLLHLTICTEYSLTLLYFTALHSTPPVFPVVACFVIIGLYYMLGFHHPSYPETKSLS